MGNSSDESFEKKERQLENLENLVENHTRTERHLEQYSHIGNENNKENAREKQEIREKQILELENKILGLDLNHIPEVQLENLKERYTSIQGYINNNKDKIPQDVLEQLEEKQKNRMKQIANLEYKGQIKWPKIRSLFNVKLLKRVKVDDII